MVVVENEAQLNKFLPIRAELTNVKAYVIYNGDAVPKGVNKDKKLAKVYDWKGFLALGEKVTEKQIEVCFEWFSIVCKFNIHLIGVM